MPQKPPGGDCGAGSVVTHDLPAGVVAVGSPCRVLRPVSDHDRAYYWKDRPVPVSYTHLTLPTNSRV